MKHCQVSKILIIIQTIAIIAFTQLIKLQSSFKPQSVFSLSKRHDGTFLQFVDYENNQLISVEYLNQQIYRLEIQLQGQIQRVFIKKSHNGSIVPSFSNGTVFGRQKIIQKFNDPITQILDLESMPGYFIATQTQFFSERYRVIQFSRIANEQITKFLYSYQREILFVGTKNGSILAYQQNPLYKENRILYFNFQSNINGKPQNTMINQPDYNITIVGDIEFDNNTQLGLGVSGLFNGSSYLVLNNLQEFDSFTICAWFNTFNTSRNLQRIFADFQNGTGFGFTINQGKLKLAYGISNQLMSQAIESNKWYHGACTFDSNQNILKLFLNGQLVDQRYQQFSMSDIGPLSIGGGRKWTNVSYFEGYIDQAMLFDIPLQNSQIKKIFEQRSWLKTQIKAEGQITCLQQSFDGNKLYFGDSLGNIYESEIKTEITAMQINKRYKNHNGSINSITQYNGKHDNYLISSDNQGWIIMTANNQSLSIVNAINIGTQILKNIYIGNIFNKNKFVSVAIGAKNIVELQIFTNQTYDFLECNLSYPKCTAEYVNFELQCLSLTQNVNIAIRIQEKGKFCLMQCGNWYNLVNGRCIQRNGWVKSFSQYVSTVLSTPTVKITCKILMPVFGFLQEVWFYSYHKRNYSQFVETIFEQTNKINNQRIIPDFFDMTVLESNIDGFGQNEMKMYVQMSPTWLRQKQKLYTLSYWQNTKKVWIVSNIYTIGGISFLLLLGLFLRKYLNNYKLIRNFRQWLLFRTVIIHVLFGVIDLNLAALSYFIFIQLKHPSFFSMGSKLSILFAYSSLFILIFYSLCFYWLVFAFSKTKYIKPLLNRTLVSFQSFTLETFLSAFKQILNSFIHSAYQLDYRIQITLLGIVNLAQLIAIVKFRKCFEKRIYLLLTFCYHLCLTLLDLEYLINYCFQDLAQYNNYIQMALFILIALSVSLLMITQFFVQLYPMPKKIYGKIKQLFQTFKNMFIKNNQIQDTNQKRAFYSKKKNNIRQLEKKIKIIKKLEITQNKQTDGEKCKKQKEAIRIDKTKKQEHKSDKNMQRRNIFQLKIIRID